MGRPINRKGFTAKVKSNDQGGYKLMTLEPQPARPAGSSDDDPYGQEETQNCQPI